MTDADMRLAEVRTPDASFLEVFAALSPETREQWGLVVNGLKVDQWHIESKIVANSMGVDIANRCYLRWSAGRNMFEVEISRAEIDAIASMLQAKCGDRS